MTRPARVIFDGHAVRANLQQVRRLAPASRIMAIVKADGYGHGIVRVARALGAEVDAFGVASVEEAARLREAELTQRIVLLEGPFEASELKDIAALDLESVVHNDAQARMFAESPLTTPLWIKVDTGMHRLGFTREEAQRALDTLARGGRVTRLMTHFAAAHWREDHSVPTQLACLNALETANRLERCCANSSAILAWPTTHADWVRPGLMLYGVSPFAEQTASDLALKPAMTVKSALIAVKRVEAGEGIGYSRGFICPEPMNIGVVAFGYADGYPRHAGTGTPILVDGIRTQVLGDCSMDMLAVDLRPVPNARLGAPVTLWGEGLPVEEIARAAGTIPYELLCRMRMRAQFIERDT